MLSAPITSFAPAQPAGGRSPQADRCGRLPLDDLRLQGRLWRANSLGAATDPTLPSGFAALDNELPGRGWPLRGVTELLTPQFGVLEWRLLAPALSTWWEEQSQPSAPVPSRRQRHAAPAPRSLLLVNPPRTLHLPGPQALELPSSALVSISATTSTQQLWAAEQAIKSRTAVLAWLPEARPTQLRRLQVAALGSNAPVFLLRPWMTQSQSSAAPLRLLVQPGERWTLQVHLLKRRGPVHEGWVTLHGIPPQLENVLTPRMRAAIPSIPPQRPAPRTQVHRPFHHHALARPVVPEDSFA